MLKVCACLVYASQKEKKRWKESERLIGFKQRKKM